MLRAATRAPVAAALSLLLSGAVLGTLSLPLLRDPGGDTFFHLGPFARAGLVLVSAALIAGVFWLLHIKTAALRRMLPAKAHGARFALAGLDVCLGCIIYLILHQLSPQAYYLYYLQIFPDLPAQWVLPGALDRERIWEIAAVGPKQRLSDLLASVGFWAVPPFTLLLHGRPSGR